MVGTLHCVSLPYSVANRRPFIGEGDTSKRTVFPTSVFLDVWVEGDAKPPGVRNYLIGTFETGECERLCFAGKRKDCVGPDRNESYPDRIETYSAGNGVCHREETTSATTG
jgi:hypothetical protein